MNITCKMQECLYNDNGNCTKDEITINDMFECDDYKDKEEL